MHMCNIKTYAVKWDIFTRYKFLLVLRKASCLTEYNASMDLHMSRSGYRLVGRPRSIMLKILPIMLLSSAQKISPLCSILCS